ncbi:MAG: hypothetical protein QOK24_62 [Verrucomicrobiota bacterium]|jgi:hypothetical protein
MSPKAILPFLFFLFLSQAYGGLDLTPRSKEYVEEGVTYRQVNFKNGDGSVTFFPPPGWTMRGQGNRLQLNPEKNLVEAVVEATPMPAPKPLDEAAMVAFKEKILATLPGGSTAVTTVFEAQNTIMPGGNFTFEVMVAYQLWGKTFQRSALLVNTPQDRLIFRFTSPREDFAQFNTAFRRSVASWQWIEPSPPTGAGPVTASN